MDFLLSVPGKLAIVATNVSTLLTRWTQAKADYVDASISSRAAAGTALDKTTWTDSRSAQLDSIPTLVANIASMLLKPTLKTPTAINLTPSVAGVLPVLTGSCGFTTAITNFSATAGVYVTVLDIAGQGVIKLLAMGIQTDNVGTKNLRLTIDGVVYLTSNLFTGNQNVINAVAAAIIGSAGPSHISFDQISFFTQFKVEIVSTVTTGTAYIFHNYHRTG